MNFYEKYAVLLEQVRPIFLQYLREEKKMTEEEIIHFFEGRYDTLRKDFINRKNDEEFYSTTKGYLFDLFLWNHSLMYQQLIQHVCSQVIENTPNEHIVDYGGGIGLLSAFLSQEGHLVTYVDIPGETMDFAKYLFEKLKLPVRVISHLEFLVETRTYDIIVGMDVLEHIENFIVVLEKWVNTAPVLIFDCTWNQDDGMQPMHYTYRASLVWLMYGYKYKKTSPLTYIRMKKIDKQYGQMLLDEFSATE